MALCLPIHMFGDTSSFTSAHQVVHDYCRVEVEIQTERADTLFAQLTGRINEWLGNRC